MILLNTFPLLLSFGLIAPLLLRVTVGLFFLTFAFQKGASAVLVRNIAFFILSILLILGAWTQVASIVSLVILAGAFFSPTLRGRINRGTLILLFVICLSLIVSGAGFYAVDLPL